MRASTDCEHVDKHYNLFRQRYKLSIMTVLTLLCAAALSQRSSLSSSSVTSLTYPVLEKSMPA
jgi:hypothetical protein